MPLRTPHSIVPLFPVFQCFYHAHMRSLIEQSLPGDRVVPTRIQIHCWFIVLSNIQRDFGIVVLARSLLRALQEGCADTLPPPIAEHRQSIDIPFVVLRLLFKPRSNGGVEPRFIAPPKTQHQPDHRCARLSHQDVLVAKPIALLAEEVLFEQGNYRRVRRYLAGWHPQLGVLHQGWSGQETIVELDVIAPARVR